MAEPGEDLADQVVGDRAVVAVDGRGNASGSAWSRQDQGQPRPRGHSTRLISPGASVGPSTRCRTQPLPLGDFDGGVKRDLDCAIDHLHALAPRRFVKNPGDTGCIWLDRPVIAVFSASICVVAEALIFGTVNG